jgi:hypothetical protein
MAPEGAVGITVAGAAEAAGTTGRGFSMDVLDVLVVLDSAETVRGVVDLPGTCAEVGRAGGGIKVVSDWATVSTTSLSVSFFSATDSTSPITPSSPLSIEATEFLLDQLESATWLGELRNCGDDSSPWTMESEYLTLGSDDWGTRKEPLLRRSSNEICESSDEGRRKKVEPAVLGVTSDRGTGWALCCDDVGVTELAEPGTEAFLLTMCM